MERSLFIEYMGDSPMIRVLDYLLSERIFDFTLSDMARNAKVGRATLYRLFDSLLKNRIIIPSRVIGRAKLFKLNKQQPVVKKLMEIDDMIVLDELKKRSLLTAKQKAR